MIHDKFTSNQKRLYDFAKEAKVVSTEKDGIAITFVEDPAVDPFIVQEIKTEEDHDEVVIKVECVEDEIFDGDCFEETEIPDDFMSTLEEVNEAQEEPKHMENFARPKFYQKTQRICLKCGKIIRVEAFKDHLKTHKNDKPQTAPRGYRICPVCGKEIKNVSFHNHVSLISLRSVFGRV